ncbi:TerB family tellurite resistance protein [Vibrio rarus]|uniref:tellurite resistance TerB family protein n=1 Tax=Vibrio rarus TaxID=413403 RepID=UPI0021C29290|nr:TerB family tellurite resistance protein [Vibrio rarus]
MFNTLQSVFKKLLDGNDLAGHSKAQPKLAMAALLCEVTAADHTQDPSEITAERQMLQKLLDLSTEETTALLANARQQAEQSVSLYDFTSQLRDLPREQRNELIKAMWTVAYADGVLDPIEESVIRKAAELIYVDHSDFVKTKLEVQPPL